jgi:hypothetical protein
MDGRDAGEIMKRFDGCRSKDAHDLMQPFILGDLKAFQEALLVYSYIPYLGTVHEGGNYQSIEDPAPVHKVKALDGVAEDTDPAYSGVGTVNHEVDMHVPL